MLVYDGPLDPTSGNANDFSLWLPPTTTPPFIQFGPFGNELANPIQVGGVNVVITMIDQRIQFPPTVHLALADYTALSANKLKGLNGSPVDTFSTVYTIA